MKKLALLLAALMLVSMLAACADESEGKDTDASDTPAVADTSAPDTEAPETEAPETEAPESEEPEETEPLIVQGEVPCNFDDAIDLSSDIDPAATEFMLGDGGGQWVLGNDATQMTNVITKDMLEEYKYLVFTYEVDYTEATYEIAFMLKFVHEDGTKTEFLCNEWFNFGPAGRTYQSSTLPTMSVYEPSGVLYLETSVLLNHEAFVETDIIDQIGIASVENTMTIPYLYITGAYLTK